MALCLIELAALVILYVSYKKNLDSLNEVTSHLDTFESCIHVLTAPAPCKRTPQYSAMKLSAALKDFIKYDEDDDECILVVLDVDSIKK